MADPPLLPGAFHETCAEPLPGVADTPVGAPGAVDGAAAGRTKTSLLETSGSGSAVCGLEIGFATSWMMSVPPLNAFEATTGKKK